MTVTIRNLSKKYLIYHEIQGNATLVETLVSLTRKCSKRIGKALTQGSQVDEKRCEEFWALRDLNLDIEQGDRLAIIGKNGAGKSTLLKIISRITEPTQGTVHIRGKVASLLEVGTGFHLELTGRENIFLNGAVLGMKRREIKQKFDEIVSFSDIEKFLDTPVKRYSSGMLTRLGFAVAAYLDPDILIVDEVLAVGDMQFQQKCLKKLDELGNKGSTVIFVSHNLGSVVSLCNKGIYLQKGGLVYEGDISSTINAYLKNDGNQSYLWQGDVGDTSIRFLSAQLKMQEANREFYYQNEKTSVEIEVEILQPVRDLIIGIGIWNRRQQLLARSYTSDDPNYQKIDQNPGRYVLSFPIDTSILHEGEYYIKIEGHIHNFKVITRDDISLKLQVYSKEQEIPLSHKGPTEGIFLGNHWQMQPKKQVIHG